MKNLILALALLAGAAFSVVASGVDKLFDNAANGVDYVMGLFDNADIVILGERDHRDTTQYDFINRLISDARFIDKVGYVYTEVGTVNTAERCARTVMVDYQSIEEFRDSTLSHIRNEDFYPMWEKYNRFQLLENIHRLNSGLPELQRVSLMGTDIAFDWSKMHDPDEYREFLDEKVNSGKRDSIMAHNFSLLFDNQPSRNSHHKALLITNTPHALLDSVNSREGYWLKKRYGEQVKVVLLNWTEWWNNDAEFYRPWLSGIPDSAYVASGQRDCGFDLVGSPLESAQYCAGKISDFADGMVYYLTPGQFVLTMGIPGAVDDSFANELMRRTLISARSAGREIVDTPESLKKYYGNKRSGNPYADYLEAPQAGLDMEFLDAVNTIIAALASGDLALLNMAGIDGDYQQLREAKLLHLGEPEPYAGGLGMRVALNLQLKDGTAISRKLFLKKNEEGNFLFDGGL